MNRNFKRAECSAKSFFCACMLLKLKKINFITVKDQLKNTEQSEKMEAF
jgi:hypothetical protein